MCSYAAKLTYTDCKPPSAHPPVQGDDVRAYVDQLAARGSQLACDADADKTTLRQQGETAAGILNVQLNNGDGLSGALRGGNVSASYDGRVAAVCSTR